MSSDPQKTQNPPVVSSSSRAIAPPKRFLDSALLKSSTRRVFQSSSRTPSTASSAPSLSSNAVSGVQFRPPALKSRPVAPASNELVGPTPPKLFRCPQLPSPPVLEKQSVSDEDTGDSIEKLKEVGVKKLHEGVNEKPSPAVSLPPLPPLIKMPISTRKETRSTFSAANEQNVAETKHETEKEPPRKRTRLGERTSESSTTESSHGPPTTPRKIIQEIFGTDKSKKGKGRKRKRAAAPKKKGASKGGLKTVTEEVSTEQLPVGDEKGDAENNDVDDVKEEDETEELQQNLVENIDTEVDNNIVKEEEEITEVKEEEKEEPEEEEQVGDEEIDDAQSITSSIRRSGRKAKQIANEKLKRLSLQADEKDLAADETENKGDSKASSDNHAAGPAADIQSRRSTTESSSNKSGSSTHDESESSSGNGISSTNNRRNGVDREESNNTPLSLISEDGDPDDVKVEGLGLDDVNNDLQEHRDSDDVDSTFSWKPVRAAAALALEQVTKNQGSIAGSTGHSGDAETKAAAAAERRARKIMRYKGRNRRTLMFKSSSSKKLITARKNRRSAQPTLIHKAFHMGNYIQRGDIVYVHLDDDSRLYGQIRGILLDQFGEISAFIRWLAPKSIVYELYPIEFNPANYAFRPDVPEKLIKLDYIKFVMHCNTDYFDGQPSYNKIEKYSVYIRMGKSVNPVDEFDSDSDSSSSESDADEDGEQVSNKNNNVVSAGSTSSESDTDEDGNEQNKKSNETDNTSSESDTDGEGEKGNKNSKSSSESDSDGEPGEENRNSNAIDNSSSGSDSDGGEENKNSGGNDSAGESQTDCSDTEGMKDERNYISAKITEAQKDNEGKVGDSIESLSVVNPNVQKEETIIENTEIEELEVKEKLNSMLDEIETAEKISEIIDDDNDNDSKDA